MCCVLEQQAFEHRTGHPLLRVLRGFIADLSEIMDWASDPRTDGYSSNGSDERRMAMEYYRRVGYPWWNKG